VQCDRSFSHPPETHNAQEGLQLFKVDSTHLHIIAGMCSKETRSCFL
jgi:hypothetical protein